MDGIERWMAAAEGTAPIFVLFNSYNVANDDSSQTLSEEIEKKEFQPDGDDDSLSRFIS